MNKGKAVGRSAPVEIEQPKRFEIVLSDRAVKDLKDLDKTLRGSVLSEFKGTIEAVADAWPHVSNDLRKKIRSSTQDLWELRIKLGKNQVRFTFLIHDGIMLVVNGGQKKSEHDFDRMVDQADRIVADWKSSRARARKC